MKWCAPSRTAKAVEPRRDVLGRAVDEVVRTQFARQRLLIGAASDRHGTEAEFVCELHPEMAEAADTQHRDDVTRHCSAVAERIERRDSGAEQRRGIEGAKLVGDCSECVGRGHHSVGITPVIGDAGNAQVTAVDQPAAPARLATSAMPSKPAYPDPLPDGPTDHTGTDCVDDTGNLVTRNPGEGKAWPLTFHRKTVTVTHPAGLDTDPHLALPRLRHLALNHFKPTATLRHLYRPHLSHRPPLYRVRLYFRPTYSSWLNQVELWFARIERDVIARGVFTFVPDLRRKLMRYIRQYIKAPKTRSRPRRAIFHPAVASHQCIAPDVVHRRPFARSCVHG